MNKKIIATCALLLLLTGGTIAVAGELVGPLGSLKLDKPGKPAAAQTEAPIDATVSRVPSMPQSVATKPAPPVAAVVATTPAPKAVVPAPAAPKPVSSTPVAPVAKAAVQASPTSAAAPVAVAAKPIATAPAVTRAAPTPVTAAAAKSVAPAATVATAAAAASVPVRATTASLPPPPAAPVSVPATLIADAPTNAGRRVKTVQLSDREIAYQEQEADLARQIRIVQMQVALRELQKKLTESDAPTADSVVLPPPPPVASVLDIPEEPVVRLISVWGDPARLTADVLAKGVRTSVKAGDPLPDGWRVVEIGRNSLLIQRGRTKSVVKIGG